jgi:hypothetical protein
VTSRKQIDKKIIQDLHLDAEPKTNREWTLTQTERQTDKKVNSKKKLNKRGSTHERKNLALHCEYCFLSLFHLAEMEKYLLAYGSKMNMVIKMSADLKQFLPTIRINLECA